MFMFGPAPIRRTLKYLNSGQFIAKDHIRVMEVQYHLHGRKYQTREESESDFFQGLRQFYFWEMPRIQYQNPKLQIVRILDKLPTPFIRFWLHDGSDILIDCYRQNRHEILERVIKVAGKSETRLKLEKQMMNESVGEHNPALFGYDRERFCACEVPGQHPCPGVIRQPYFDQILLKLSSGRKVF